MLARGTKQVGAGKLELDQTQIELDPVPPAEPVLTTSLQQWMATVCWCSGLMALRISTCSKMAPGLPPTSRELLPRACRP